MEYGYARASTNSDKQDISRQKRELVAIGIKEHNIFGEYESGSNEGREKLQQLLETVIALRKLIEKAFCSGIAVGISLYQRGIVSAHEREKPLKIGDTLYYVQDGRERLAEVLEKICR